MKNIIQKTDNTSKCADAEASNACIVSALDQLWGICNNLVDFMYDMLPLNDGRVISAREALDKAQDSIGELLKH